jgi:two-component system KDP operon response regulator KdpE
MAKERILIVDDEKTIRMVIADALEAQGYQINTAASPAEALDIFNTTPCDLALIDLKIPGPMDGIGLLKELRQRSPQTIVIMLTGFATFDSAIAAMREGAFDYLTKPASITQIIESVQRGLAKRREDIQRQQLIAQLEQTLHALRVENEKIQSPIDVSERFTRTATLVIDRYKRLVIHGTDLLDLTSTEFDILDYLARHADRVITASELVKATQGYDLSEADARPLIRVHIQRLRQKLEDDPENPRFIATIRGKGYRFVG